MKILMILTVFILTACTNEQWNEIDEKSKDFEFPSMYNENNKG
jgi:hypothetical protein